jgi:hypothetical protein
VIEELNSLRHEDAPLQRERLLARRPASDLRVNWWLGVIQVVSGRATNPDLPDADRSEWAGLAAVALDTARDAGDLDAHEVVYRKANLSLALTRYGSPQSFSPALRPDLVVRDSLAEAGMSSEEAAATPWQLRAEDIDIMRKLRRVRNIVAPAVQLAAHVEDEQTKRELAAWSEVLPKLP